MNDGISSRNNTNSQSSLIKPNNSNSIDKQSKRIKKTKPLSMNETMLNKIVKDSINKKSAINIIKDSIPNSIKNSSFGLNNNKSGNINNYILTEHQNNSQTSLNLNTEASHNYNNHKAHIPNIKQKVAKSKSNSKTKVTFNPNSNANPSHSKKNSISSLSNNLNNFTLHNKESGNDIPIHSTKHLNKIPSNGLDTLSSHGHSFKNTHFLKSEISNSSLNTERDILFTTSSNFRPNNKLNEELLEYKLNNAKLKNEINILQEKIKTLKQVINMKNNENELVKSKYVEIIEEYKKEVDKMKKINSEYTQIRDSNVKQNCYIKSVVSVMIDMMEFLIAPRTSNYANSNFITRQSMNNNYDNISNTSEIDIYCSYNNDEDKRGIIIEQIQGLLVAKLNVMKKNVVNLDLEKEIERIKSWNIKVSNETEVNISNLRISKNNIEESSESFRKTYSNDFFDLSISNQMLTQSPKFNSVEISNTINKELNHKNNNSIMNMDNKGENQILNDSFLKDLKQSNIIILIYFMCR
jgi:hypothetical protein